MSDAAAGTGPVRDWLLDLQDRICAALEQADGSATFDRRERERPDGGLTRPRVLAGGPVLEQAAVHFSFTNGSRLPEAATARRPELAGQAYQAVSVSLIVHPRNPYAPTCHANFRCFAATAPGTPAVWWFGGGFDLTPYYGFVEDVVHWHTVARDACLPFGPDVHPRFKEQCDRYFFLPHRNERRGVGGLFFDDLDDGGFARCFALTRSIGEAFLPAYLPILERRKATPHGERERDFQLYRRGRYVEFNLLYDRGTRFGLQAGGPADAILASLPPLVRFEYDHQDPPGSPEAELLDRFLKPRDWLAD